MIGIILVALILWALVRAGGNGGNTATTTATTTGNGEPNPTLTVSNFDECVQAGYAVMESYPAQCRAANGTTFTQNIGNELEKTNLIKITSPRPNASIQSPLTVEGQARGTWYFEASFPIQLKDANGKVITLVPESGTPGTMIPVQAQGDWMTENFVPFKVKFSFAKPATATGTLILLKDNPSGLPENDDSLIVPVVFK